MKIHINAYSNFPYDLNDWRYTCPNCGRINIQDSKRPSDKCHRCGFPRKTEQNCIIDENKE